MQALVVEPGKAPYEKEIEPGLESLQREVDGYIEAVGLDENATLICNEEGKLNGLELNRALYDERGNMTDIIAGKFLVVGAGEENFESLTPQQMDQYKHRFRKPEVFLQLNGRVLAIPVEPPRQHKPKAKNGMER